MLHALGFQQQTPDAPNFNVPRDTHAEWLPVMRHVQELFVRERAWLATSIAERASIEPAAAAASPTVAPPPAISPAMSPAASSVSKVNTLANWVAFARVYLAATDVQSRALRGCPLSDAVLKPEVAAAPAPAALAATAASLTVPSTTGGVTATNSAASEDSMALAPPDAAETRKQLVAAMRRSYSERLPNQADNTRDRIVAALRLHVDWQTLTLWPYLQDVHHENWVLPNWAVATPAAAVAVAGAAADSTMVADKDLLARAREAIVDKAP